MSFVVKTLTGKSIPCELPRDSSVLLLKFVLEEKEGIPTDQMRIVFSGAQLEDDVVLADQGVTNGAEVWLFLRLSGDIGVFSKPSDSFHRAAAGEEWLRAGLADPRGLSREEAVAVHAAVPPAGDHTAVYDRPPVASEDTAVSDAGCDALERLVEAEYARWMAAGCPSQESASLNHLESSVVASSRADDFRMVLTLRELEGVVGSPAVRDVLAGVHVPGLSPKAELAVALRRTEATGRWISLHRDPHTARTVQVPLSGDGECDGGRLFYLLPSGEVRMADRVRGRMLAHDGDVVHGVTALTRGVRRGLYVLKGRA